MQGDSVWVTTSFVFAHLIFVMFFGYAQYGYHVINVPNISLISFTDIMSFPISSFTLLDGRMLFISEGLVGLLPSGLLFWPFLVRLFCLLNTLWCLTLTFQILPWNGLLPYDPNARRKPQSPPGSLHTKNLGEAQSAGHTIRIVVVFLTQDLWLLQTGNTCVGVLLIRDSRHCI